MKDLEEQGPFDGVFLALHGAMAVTGIPKPEAEIARRVRAAVGDTPIGRFSNLAEQRLGRLAGELSYTDIAEIMAYGVMTTPGVVVDGKVVHAGGLPGPDQARAWVRE